MERDLTNFVDWSKEISPELLPENFNFNQQFYSKDRELIKAYLKLSKKQHEEILEFSMKYSPHAKNQL